LNKTILLCFLLLGFLGARAQQFIAIHTNKGKIVVMLYDETPKHKENFIKLVEDQFYDSTLFHRVIADFMIQCGDPNSKGASKTRALGSGGPGYTIEAEIVNSYIHKKGALAAARQGDNINPRRKSSGSQFYIVQGRVWPRKYMDKFEENREEPYTEEQLKTYETLGGTPHLDGQYTVFGEVVEGLEVVDAIAAVPTGSADRPVDDVIILKMELVK
jgi:peptidyl-prolyl cis-trans isomerase B (cyclophilin B)